MKSRQMLILLLTMLILSCGPKMSGKDEESFKASKAKMEEKLDKADQEKLGKALRVIMVKAMKEKFTKPNDALYKGKSFDEISQAMTDGKNFTEIVNYAEDFLKADRDSEIKNTKIEIDSLTKQSVKFMEQNKVLDQFKLTKMSITEVKHFNKKKPSISYTFTNNTGSEVLGYMVEENIYLKTTGKVLSSSQFGNRSELDPSIKDGDAIKPGAEVLVAQVLNGIDGQSEFLKNAKYPITDFSKLDFVVEISPILLITRKGTLGRAGNLPRIDKKIKYLQSALKKLEQTKGTLEELVLTD